MGSVSLNESKKKPFSERPAGSFTCASSSNDTTVLVPVANVDGVGLRKAITDEEVDRLFSLLGDGKIDNHQNWKGRFKDNSDKMRTGSIYDMADVLKSLTFLSKSKSLSFREKRMLDRAKALIISEMSEVMREKALEVEERVDQALEKCFMTKARNITRTQRARPRSPSRSKAARCRRSWPAAVRPPARRSPPGGSARALRIGCAPFAMPGPGQRCPGPLSCTLPAPGRPE